MTIFSAAVLLILVMDPFGNIPLFVSALKDVDKSRHIRIVVRELIIALAVLVLFLFAGQHVLQTLQITGPALTVAGGIVLFLIAVRLVFPTAKTLEEEVSGEPFVVPLAIPYLAGPSALAAVLLIMSRDPSRWGDWLAALLIAWFVSGLIIMMSSALARRLGMKVLIAIERLMGMVLVAISVQMVMSGLAEFIAST